MNSTFIFAENTEPSFECKNILQYSFLLFLLGSVNNYHEIYISFIRNGPELKTLVSQTRHFPTSIFFFKNF